MIRRVWCLALLVAALGSPTAPVAGPLSPPPGGVIATHFYSYVPGDDDLGAGPVTVVVGTTLLYANADLLAHTVTAVSAPGEEPAFDSGVLMPGEVGIVTGVEHLPPGDRPFFCTLHPFLMRGTLRVLG